MHTAAPWAVLRATRLSKAAATQKVRSASAPERKQQPPCQLATAARQRAKSPHCLTLPRLPASPDPLPTKPRSPHTPAPRDATPRPPRNDRRARPCTPSSRKQPARPAPDAKASSPDVRPPSSSLRSVAEATPAARRLGRARTRQAPTLCEPRDPAPRPPRPQESTPPSPPPPALLSNKWPAELPA